MAARYRRRRAFVLLVLIGGAAALTLGVRSIGGGSGASSVPSADAIATRTHIVTRVSSHLPAPLSGESAVAQGGRILVLGGLDPSQASSDAVLALDPGTGSVTSLATLPAPVHDAAAVLVGANALLFGGGQTVSTPSVELVKGGAVRAAGQLPAPRSDLAATSVGGRAYLLGGYDGQTLDPSVLSTADGRRFDQVASLPVPVRYPALAAVGSSLYAFGGQTADGSPTDVIQQVDTSAGQARVIGHLPEPLAHASAVALGGTVYVLGGRVAGRPTDAISAFAPPRGRVHAAGRLPVPVADAAVTVAGGRGYLIGGVGAGGSTLDTVISIAAEQVPVAPPATTSTSTTTTDPAPDPASVRPFAGRLLIADRGNDRLLLVNAHKQILWRYPGPGKPPPPGGFNFPDDAFFTHDGRGIITNQEENETIVQLAFPSGRVVSQYGHPGQIGSSPGYLHEPDDAYLLRDGTITVADAQNCRVLVIPPGGRPATQIGTTGVCAHDPPRTLGSPNGDTPLRNGNLLVSEVNGSWIDEVTLQGRLIWTVHLPIAYPSDPQQLGPDRYLVANYASPGGVYEFNRAGRILWSYAPSSGAGMLDHPSLAEQLPNGLIAVNDDYRHRLVLIDPKTKRIVWQYGHTDQAGTAAGYLNTPDGFDLLFPGGSTPTHPYTG